MEASIALTATLLPAMERVERVTIVPSAKSPLGRTVLEVRGLGRGGNFLGGGEAWGFV